MFTGDDMSTWRAVLSSVVLAGGLLAGCARGQPDSTPQAPPPPAVGANVTADSALPADVVDVTWQWVSFTTPVEQVSVDAPERYTLRFERSGHVSVRADCNRGMTTYSAGADRRIALHGPIALTRAMCPPGSLSDRFATEVTRGTSYFLRDGDLFLELPFDSGTLQFRRQP
jgi:heat shock protein HslJ